MATAQRVSAAMAHLGAIKPLGDQTNTADSVKAPAFNFGIGKAAAVAPSADHFQVRVTGPTRHPAAFSLPNSTML